jgi:hypothetical protein
MSSTPSIQDLVMLINVALISITLIVRIPSSPFMVYGEKPEKFNKLNFKIWQQKILFYLTILNFAKFLNEKAPKSSKK